jgi:glycerol transport system ATP-binding protein
MTLVLENVSKKVGRETHIDRVSLDLDPGAPVVLLGRTLAGKTTLIRLMAGLDRPTKGRVKVDGRDVTGVSVRKRNVAMVYQQFINYPSFTVYDNIASPLRRAGLGKGEIERKVREAAAILRIEELLDRLPNELSGGQQQRTALARALVKDADLLLLDEPLMNLDYKLREELRGELQTIFGGRKSIVVYATTEPLEALLIGGTTVILDEGKALQVGPTLDVYHNPASVRVGEVFSDPPMNLVAGRVEDGNLRLDGDIIVPRSGHLAGLAPGSYRFGVRANHLFVVREMPDLVFFDATVELAEISGSETFIHAARGGFSWVVQEEGVHSFSLGQSVRVFLNPSDIFVFDEAGRLAAAPVRRSAKQGGMQGGQWRASS